MWIWKFACGFYCAVIQHNLNSQIYFEYNFWAEKMLRFGVSYFTGKSSPSYININFSFRILRFSILPIFVDNSKNPTTDNCKHILPIFSLKIIFLTQFFIHFMSRLSSAN